MSPKGLHKTAIVSMAAAVTSIIQPMINRERRRNNTGQAIQSRFHPMITIVATTEVFKTKYKVDLPIADLGQIIATKKRPD